MNDRLVSNVNQIALIVHDVQGAAKVFSEGFGVSSILNVRFGVAENDDRFRDNTVPIEDVHLDGRYIGTYGIEMAAAGFENGIQLELIEPAGNPSIFHEYLEEYGPGAQHIAVDNTCSFYEMIGRMAAAGNPLGQYARVDSQEECAFIRHRDTLGVDIELHNRPEDFRFPEAKPDFIMADRGEFPKPLITKIASLNFVVDRLEPVLHMLRDRYGLAEWELEEAHQLIHAYHRAMNVELQILEAQSEDSHAAAWLKKHRKNGICSIEFEVDADKEQIRNALRKIGRRPEDMFANKISADFEDIFGMGLIFRAMR